MLVPVAAVLVASIRLPFLDSARAFARVARVTCPAPHFRKGEEMGWFGHGSTILLLAPSGFTIADAIAEEGARSGGGTPCSAFTLRATVGDDGIRPTAFARLAIPCRRKVRRQAMHR